MRLGSDLPVDSVRLVACPRKNRSSQSSQRRGRKRRSGRTARSKRPLRWESRTFPLPQRGQRSSCRIKTSRGADIDFNTAVPFPRPQGCAWHRTSSPAISSLKCNGKFVAHARDGPVPAIVVVSAEIDESPAKVTSAQSFEELRRGHSLWQQVKSLHCLKIESGAVTNDRKPLWEGSLRMQSVARNPTDTLRTFYTSDLDTMLMGNFLLEK
jgi:hypothetical protein